MVTVSYIRTSGDFWSGDPGQYQRIATMPAGLRPRSDLRAFAFSVNGAVEYMYVGADGAMGFTNIGSAGSTMDGFFGCVITYAVATEVTTAWSWSPWCAAPPRPDMATSPAGPT